MSWLDLKQGSAWRGAGVGCALSVVSLPYIYFGKNNSSGYFQGRILPLDSWQLSQLHLGTFTLILQWMETMRTPAASPHGQQTRGGGRYGGGLVVLLQ